MNMQLSFTQRSTVFILLCFSFQSSNRFSAILKLYTNFNVKHKNEELKLLITRDFGIFSLFPTMNCHLYYTLFTWEISHPRHIQKVREVRTANIWSSTIGNSGLDFILNANAQSLVSSLYVCQSEWHSLSA